MQLSQPAPPAVKTPQSHIVYLSSGVWYSQNGLTGAIENSNADFKTLMQAVINLGSGEIRIKGAQTATLTAQLTTGANLICITGEGSVTIIQGPAGANAFTIPGGGELMITNLTLNDTQIGNSFISFWDTKSYPSINTSYLVNISENGIIQFWSDGAVNAVGLLHGGGGDASALYLTSLIANSVAALRVMPKGAPVGNVTRSTIQVFLTDFRASNVNYEAMEFTAEQIGGVPVFLHNVFAAGTGVLREYRMYMNADPNFVWIGKTDRTFQARARVAAAAPALADIPTGMWMIHENTTNNAVRLVYENNAGTALFQMALANPTGVAAIVVGASPFTYTNNDGIPEAIYINGGTVSNISKNGSTIFNQTNATVYLLQGESVVVTYTVVPFMAKDQK